jgi:hypothetical protein
LDGSFFKVRSTYMMDVYKSYAVCSGHIRLLVDFILRVIIFFYTKG